MIPLPATLEAEGSRLAAALPGLPPERRTEAIRVFALSEFAAATAARHVDWFTAALATHGFEAPFSRSDLERDCAGTLSEAGDPDSLKRGLRVIRARFQLWIVWRHCLGRADLRETTAASSLLADVLIDRALEHLYEWLMAARGVPTGADSGTPVRLAVIALGKLGGQELNLSSDVDLMFCYREPGRTEPLPEGGGRAGELNQQFFVRLGQQLIDVLDSVTEDGFVFRVDMRLRPFGASGPLVLDFESIENYYATQGRDWERYALMKARPCAGDRLAGQALLDELSPFVYRRYLDFGAIEALRDMKARLVADRKHPDDVKLGPGGIREVEFSVQMQQMIWGGREPALRQRRLLDALRALPELGHMSPERARVLDDGYRFLRDTEHSLQAEADRQTQRLPRAERSQARLAVCMGFASYAEFRAELDRHRQAISAVFDELLGPTPEAEATGLTLWTQLDEESRFREAGFRDPGRARTLLQRLAAARDRPSVSGQGRQRLDTLMPKLLEDILQSPDPDLALERVEPVVRGVLRRSAYLALLNENPHTRAHFVELVSRSRWLARELAEHPAFFDSLLDERVLSAVPDRNSLVSSLNRELARVEGDFEQALEVLREFKNHHVFEVALAEVRGTLPLMKVSDALTWLAEAVLEAALGIAWEESLERFPEYAEPRPFIIVGYGKLGGIELGPDSDLDLVFLHDLPAAAAPFLHRLVRRLLHVLTAQTYNGTLYEIDTRLRPSGNAGTMVSSLESFVAYQEKEAWTWEHQALVRARPVAGDPQLASRFQAARRQILCRQRDPGELRKAVLEMRDRMRAQLPPGEEAVDLKRGTGGIVDIEFVVQYLVLAHAHAHPVLTEYTDNVRILEAVDRARLLPAGAAARLTDAYLALREQWHRSVLDIPDSARAAQTLARVRDDVKAIWKSVFEDGEPG